MLVFVLVTGGLLCETGQVQEFRSNLVHDDPDVCFLQISLLQLLVFDNGDYVYKMSIANQDYTWATAEAVDSDTAQDKSSSLYKALYFQSI